MNIRHRAWAYVGLRVLHTLVHVGYNNITHRFLVFGASVTALLLLWIQALRAALS